MVADANVLPVLQAYAAFKSLGHFLGVVLEALERRNFAGVKNDAFANEANAAISLYHAVRNIAARDGSNLGNFESVLNFHSSDDLLLCVGAEHSFHGSGDFVDTFIDDGILANLDFFLVGQKLCLWRRADVEAYDNRVGVRRRQNDVAFVDRAGRRVDDHKSDVLCRKLFKGCLKSLGASLQVGFDDHFEFLDFVRVNRLVKVVKRDFLDGLGVLKALKLHALGADGARLFFAFGHLEGVARVGHVLNSDNLNRLAGSRFLNALAPVVEHRAHAA